MSVSLSNRKTAESGLAEHRELLGRAEALIATFVVEAAARIRKCFEDGGKLMLAGNGGSAADAQHMAAEFVGRYSFDRPGLPAVALTTDTSALTAIANDFGYNRVFARQVEALGQARDIFLGISTSGNSPSIIEALDAARARKIFTITLLGDKGGKALEKSDLALVIPSPVTARVQELHLLSEHLLCEAVEAAMFRSHLSPP